MKILLHIVMLMLTLVAVSCYNGRSSDHDGQPESDTMTMSALRAQRKSDSLSFYSRHHYTVNHNFIVAGDSLLLRQQPPEELMNHVDTFYHVIHHGEDVVVAEIRIIPTDTIDSVWVKVAHDQERIGWVHEEELLSSVTPNDPISMFISVFSNIHLLLTLVLVAVVVMVYMLFLVFKKKARVVHVNDIPSFYPTALLLTVAMAATFYSSIQIFAPEIWKHFYYHPTLNPFAVPPLLAIFLMMVWLLPIALISAVDDAFRHLPAVEAMLYTASLAVMCLCVYVVFSVTTLYYVGYPLLVVYVGYSIRSFYAKRRLAYFCGNCGKAILRKGQCPYCGATNV